MLLFTFIPFEKALTALLRCFAANFAHSFKMLSDILAGRLANGGPEII